MRPSHLNIILTTIILNFFSTEINGNVVNKIARNFDNLSTEKVDDNQNILRIINSTNLFVNEANLSVKNTSENKRHGKSVFALVDLEKFINTGVDDESSINELVRPLVTPRASQLNNQLFSMLQYYPNINEQIQLALSNYLSNQQVQPINKLLRDAKLTINNRERQNSRKPSKIHQQFDETIDGDDDDDSLEIKETKLKKNSSRFDNISALKDLIRSSVVEALNENNKPRKPSSASREADDLEDMNADVVEDKNKPTEKPTDKPTEKPKEQNITTTTVSPINGYYYGGNAQNTSDVNLVQDTYGPPQNGYNYRPFYNQGFNYQGLYGPPSTLSEPPAYGPEPFRPDYGYYDQPDSSNFPNLVEPWPVQQAQPIYYARGRQITQDDKSFVNGNTFIPSTRLSRQT